MCDADYGTLTLLFQDSVSGFSNVHYRLKSDTNFQVGGLEVQHPHTKVFHPAPPIVSLFQRFVSLIYPLEWSY